MAYKNPEDKKAYNNAWAKANREKCNAAQLKWNQKNRDKLHAIHRAYRERHPEKRAAMEKSWRDRNREKVLEWKRKYSAMRRARLRLATIGDLTAIAKVYERAEHLRQWFDVCVDHIWPLAKGGTHSPDNLQIIYRSENNHKRAQWGYEPKVIFR